MDPLTPSQRSRNMAAIKSVNTAPEMIVRRIVHGMGFRYRLHVRALPGTPDLVFVSRRRIIEVRGCFWHLHGCKKSTIPVTRANFWRAKLKGNARRDERMIRVLRRMGWRVLVIWQCQTVPSRRELLERRLLRFLE
jgi:DNA mismatch endonuclease Vsr